ncbi:MAG TPA: CRISPR-associated endonuclease Cas2 [Candidatus Cloacimonadota bacterium]|nr:CRISPR-associated endonuclease Cas2 [Candidatus Cloacimonadota bacterium]
MAVNKSLYLVCFDIVENKCRYRIVKILLKYGFRVQKSVFECSLNDKQFLDMKHEIETKINFTQDSVRYYQICKKCAGTIQISGLGVFIDDEELIIV